MKYKNKKTSQKGQRKLLRNTCLAQGIDIEEKQKLTKSLRILSPEMILVSDLLAC